MAPQSPHHHVRARRVSAMALSALVAATASCRSPEGTPENPVDTSATPFVKEAPPTNSEAERNNRFEDMRRTRFIGSDPIKPRSAGASENETDS